VLLQGSGDAAAAADSSSGAVLAALHGHQLHVQVHGAAGLRGVSWQRSCCSQTRVSFAGTQHSTAVVQDNHSPQWNSVFVFESAPVLARADEGLVVPGKLALQLEVWHTDRLARDGEFLGQARVALR
jgi:hypothetical protein